MVEGVDAFGVFNHISELQAMLKHIEPDKLDLVLDAGCGNGRFLAALPAGTPSIGLDASLNLLRITRGKQRGQFHVCAELEHIPFRDGVFGTVVSCRVLQHLVKQREAVHEISRVIRPRGIVVLELYNQWNPKTIYKNIRMSRYRKIFDAPFRLVFRSMSPFSDWGLTYDKYNNWFEVKRWLRETGMGDFQGRGVGFGYHKYFTEAFYINDVLQKHFPNFLKRYINACLWTEQRIGPVIPFRYTLEKFVLRGMKK
jgi:ubiquinone/menaquinone biosynthesis C-methylase UbiE